MNVSKLTEIALLHINSEGTEDLKLWWDDAVDETTLVKVFMQQLYYRLHTPLPEAAQLQRNASSCQVWN